MKLWQKVEELKAFPEQAEAYIGLASVIGSESADAH